MAKLDRSEVAESQCRHTEEDSMRLPKLSPRNVSTESLFTTLLFAAALLTTALGLLAAPAQAKVKRIAIDKAKSESPAYGGKTFGSVGQYEKLVGHATANSIRKIRTIRSSPIFSLRRATRMGWWSTWRLSRSLSPWIWAKRATCCCMTWRIGGGSSSR